MEEEATALEPMVQRIPNNTLHRLISESSNLLSIPLLDSTNPSHESQSFEINRVKHCFVILNRDLKKIREYSCNSQYLKTTILYSYILFTNLIRYINSLFYSNADFF